MLATVASVNSANRLKAHLAGKYSVNSRILQTPSAISRDGCGYSLRFSDGYKAMVERSAAELHINIRAFFREETKGNKVNYIKE